MVSIGYKSILRSLLVWLVACGLAFAQDSILDLRQATIREPDNINVWLDLGNAYIENKDYVSAEDSFLEAIALDYRSADAHFGLGLAEFEQGDYPAALFEFTEVTRLFPDRFDGHFNRAVTLVKLRRFDEAAEAFQESIAQADPEATPAEKVAAYEGLGLQLSRAEDYEGAAAAYGSAVELSPNNIDLVYLRAEALLESGQALEVLSELSELENEMDDYRLSSIIADAYIKEEQVDYAVRSLERALRQAQGSQDGDAQANILIKLGLLQSELGRQDEAISSLQRAVTIEPNSWLARYYLGYSYLQDGQPETAVGYLEDAVKINADSVDAQLALATAYSQVNRTEEALAIAEMIQSRLEDPSLVAQADFVIGRALYNQGDYEGALGAFEVALEDRPDDASVQLWTGLSEYQLENYEGAVQYIERAVQLDPDNIDARVNLGAAYLVSERFQDAELVYQLLVEEFPDDAEVYFNLGWSLFSQNRLEAAKEAWLKSSGLDYKPAQDALQKYF